MLDKDSFLKLMMVELQHQDPLQPSDPTQYINELSQMTTLEQTTNMAASSAKTAAEETHRRGAADARPLGQLHRCVGQHADRHGAAGCSSRAPARR